MRVIHPANIYFSITRLSAVSFCLFWLSLISYLVIELLNPVCINLFCDIHLIQLYICKWDLYLLYCLRLTFKCSHSFYYNFVSKTSTPYVSKGNCRLWSYILIYVFILYLLPTSPYYKEVRDIILCRAWSMYVCIYIISLPRCGLPWWLRRSCVPS